MASLNFDKLLSEVSEMTREVVQKTLAETAVVYVLLKDNELLCNEFYRTKSEAEQERVVAANITELHWTKFDIVPLTLHIDRDEQDV